MSNRVTAAAEAIRPAVDALPAEKREALRAGLELTFHEHYAYQTAQARAHAEGTLTLEEAQTIYIALGESAGWSTADLALQVVITQTIGELLAGRMAAR